MFDAVKEVLAPRLAAIVAQKGNGCEQYECAWQQWRGSPLPYRSAKVKRRNSTRSTKPVLTKWMTTFSK